MKTQKLPAGPLPETATLTDFALLCGFKQGYASQLKAAGRLVLTEDGKRVRVAQSLDRIAATADPSKAGVAARHAQARGAATTTTARAPAQVDPVDDDEDEPDDDPAASGSASSRAHTGSRFQEARAQREQHLADMAGMDLAARRGELLDREAVRSACSDAVTTFRTRLESLSTTLGPQLAPVTDEARCVAMLAEHFGHLLEELERKFKAMTPEVV